MKLMISLGILIFGTIGGWLGAVALDHGNEFGGWAILMSGIGGLVGIWIGYKVGKNFS